MANGMAELATRDDLAAGMPTLKAELAKFRRDLKWALALQAIIIVALTVTLIKLLP